ncbi:MAG: hypothetical protein PHQ11_14605 [Paludibacter sp.]|nr:hypothetical protein [Paludibacter sp.]
MGFHLLLPEIDDHFQRGGSLKAEIRTRKNRMQISGYRYYSPGLGRWLNRDPIEERIEINDYSLLDNKTLFAIDFLRLMTLSGNLCCRPINIQLTKVEFVEHKNSLQNFRHIYIKARGVIIGENPETGFSRNSDRKCVFEWWESTNIPYKNFMISGEYYNLFEIEPENELFHPLETLQIPEEGICNEPFVYSPGVGYGVFHYRPIPSHVNLACRILHAGF